MHKYGPYTVALRYLSGSLGLMSERPGVVRVIRLSIFPSQ